jgi:DinB superfamily
MVLILVAGAPALAGPMTPLERSRLVAHLEMTSGWLLDEVAGLTPAQLAFRPAPASWSIAEVLDHLVVVGPIYWQDLQNALKTPVGRQSSNTDLDLLWYGIDRSRPEKAIPSEVPAGKTRPLTEMLADYRRAHARLLDYARTTTDDLRAHYVARQGCDAYQWALLISTHEQRHILQIREIKASASFPKR